MNMFICCKPFSISACLLSIIFLAGCASSPYLHTRDNNRQTAKQLIADAVERGQFALAVDIYRGLPVGKNEPSITFNGAIAMFYMGEHVESEQLLQGLAANYPASPKGVFGLALTRYLRGAPDEALDVLTSHLDVVPFHPSTVNMVALCLDMQGKHRDAQEIYSKLAEDFPSNREFAWLNSAYSYFVVGEKGKARLQLSRLSTHTNSTIGRLAAENYSLFKEDE